MQGSTRTRRTMKGAGPIGANAVVWIEEGRALVLRDDAGAIAETEVPLPDLATATLLALAEVAHQVGAVDRVLVMGPEELRTALEREIVAIGHAPETIREAPLEGPVDRGVLLTELRRLA
ncbi:MAG: hypothetical protein ACYDAN_14575 [Candidatus Limnocylindrales bacterium]